MQSRRGLAKALKYVKGPSADLALLKLNSDTDGDVRKEALASIKLRPFETTFNVSSLINSSNWQSRRGLAKALEFVKGKNVIDALIKLLSDSDGDVRAAAKASLQAHGYDN